ncbi:CLUMA_CG001585, isoform A [Clunio marinus]|uniref:CLUMA_CG001585, isoform A n=1 Tax=Clunio marinus TaxID=568069 RepID=A0A1J1HIE5_9DIPT|nr:CLUMA_CG001585, isoform A [Clunio marinus]
MERVQARELSRKYKSRAIKEYMGDNLKPDLATIAICNLPTTATQLMSLVSQRFVFCSSLCQKLDHVWANN